MRTLVHTTGDVVLSASLEEVKVLHGADLMLHEGIITAIAPGGDLVQEWDAERPRDDLALHDLRGAAVIPGLIDAHTHLIWDGDRTAEIGWRNEGKTYQEIAVMGGGIRKTVDSTRAAGKERLEAVGVQRALAARRHGTTHLEAKSGYGLETATELLLIEVADRIGRLEGLPGVQTTWLGAHDIPKGETEKSTVERLLTEELPAVEEQGLASGADVFCEPGWFGVESTEEILKTASQAGLEMRLHIDEFEDGGGAMLASELGVVTADHALASTESGMEAMNNAGVNVGWLPGTPHMMGMKVRDPYEAKGSWTIASDFNPNCPSLSLPFAASLLVHRTRLSPSAALAAVTNNAAKTTSRADGLVHGQLEVGAAADLNVVGSGGWEGWCISPGHTPFSSTYIGGIRHFHDDGLNAAPTRNN